CTAPSGGCATSPRPPARRGPRPPARSGSAPTGRPGPTCAPTPSPPARRLPLPPTSPSPRATPPPRSTVTRPHWTGSPATRGRRPAPVPRRPDGLVRRAHPRLRHPPGISPYPRRAPRRGRPGRRARRLHGRTGPGVRRSGAAGRMDRRPGRPDRRPGRAPDAGPARAAAASAHRADPRPRRRGVNRRSGGQDGVMTYHVASETGRLRRVILHRPDLELKRLTPSNKDDLLFDDVLWVRRARAEHDGFADVLRDRGVT